MTCREFTDLVTDLIEGQLDAFEAAAAEGHLGDCHGCSAYLEQMRLTIAALRALGRNGDHPETRARALADFRRLRGAAR